MKAIKPRPGDIIVVENHPMLIRMQQTKAEGKLLCYYKKKKQVVVEFPNMQESMILDLSVGKFIIKRKPKGTNTCQNATSTQK